MKKSLFLLAFLLLAERGFGQEATWMISDTSLAADFFQKMKSFNKSAQYDSALVCGLKSLEIFEATTGRDSPGAARCHEELSLSYFYKKQGKRAQSHAERLLEIRLSTPNVAANDLAQAYNRLGSTFALQSRWDSACLFFQPAFHLWNEMPIKNERALAAVRTNLAGCASMEGRENEAIQYYLPNIRYYQAQKDSLQVSSMYSNLGRIQAIKGNARAAISEFEKAISLLNRNNRKHLEQIANCQNNLGYVHSQAGFSDKAVQQFRQALFIWEKLYGEDAYICGLAHRNIANYLKHDLPLAELHARKSVSIYDGNTGTNKADLSAALVALGSCMAQAGKQEEALKAFQRALYVHPVNSDKSEILINIGVLFAQKSHHDSALVYYQKALAELDIHRIARVNYTRCLALIRLATLQGTTGDWDAAEGNLDSLLAATGYKDSNLKASSYPHMTLRAVSEKGRLHQLKYLKTKELEFLQKSKALFQEYELLFQDWRRERIETGFGDEFAEDAHRVWEASIHTGILFHQHDSDAGHLWEAYRQAESAHSLTLLENIRQSQALRFSGIPDSILQLENDLAADLNYWEKKRWQARDISPEAAIAFDANLTEIRAKRERLQKTLETDFPQYHNLKYDLRTETVASVQRDLLYPDMALVEYFVGDSAVYIFAIRKNGYTVQEVKKDFPLETWVAQLRTGLTAFHTDPTLATWYDSLSAMYTDAAFKIYQKLVAPIAAQLPKHVVFVPDGVLGYVPFEALLSEKPANPARWNTHRYLLNDYTVSYCYSATMLREMRYRRHKQQPALGFLGFAPQYDGDTTLLSKLYPYANDMRKALKPLPHSGEEVYRSAKIMDGQSLVGTEATEVRFNEMAGQARILHLATHGQANDRSGDYCFLAFEEREDSLENELLYARDIYNLQLNADLVTLSACETGIGELQGGEGIISLARAFAYAGAKSIVTSLWSVSDAKTKDLMVDFYKNLRRGALKDEALRQAKLNYLKRNKGQAAHPFFWASFIAIGDMAPLRK